MTTTYATFADFNRGVSRARAEYERRPIAFDYPPSVEERVVIRAWAETDRRDLLGPRNNVTLRLANAWFALSRTERYRAMARIRRDNHQTGATR